MTAIGKTFLVRAGSLTSVPDALVSFGKNNKVVIPMETIDELEKAARKPDEKSKLAIKVLEYIETFDANELVENGCKQSNGSILQLIDSNHFKEDHGSLKKFPDLNNYDKRCLQIALGLKRNNEKVIIISRKTSFRIKAKQVGIEAQNFKDEIFPALTEQYSGRLTCPVEDSLIDKFYSDKKISVNLLPEGIQQKLQQNMFVTLKGMDNPQKSALTRFDGNCLVELVFKDIHPYSQKTKNSGQLMLKEALLTDPQKAPLVIVKGPAGTGKTFLSLAVALEKTIKPSEEHVYDKILIGAPIHANELGYLPGEIMNKADPYIIGFKNNLRILLKKDSKKNKNNDSSSNEDPVAKLFEDNIIDIQPVETLRGASISNAIYIIDECQNIKSKTIKTIITRAAEGCKIVLLGDPSQTDERSLNEKYNGITYASEIWKGNSLAWQVYFEEDESVRSELAKEAAKIM